MNSTAALERSTLLRANQLIMAEISQPPLVEETLLKKRRSLDDLIYKRSVTVQVQNKVAEILCIEH